MTTKLPPEQSKLDRVIIDELFACVPEEWNAFAMIVEPRKTDGDGVSITIINPDVADAEVEPTQKIRESIDKLVAFLAKEKRDWEVITYKAFCAAEGTWKINITVPLPPAAAS